MRKIRRRIKAKQKGDYNDTSEGPSKTGERRQRGTKAASGTPPRKGKDSKSSKHVTKEGTTHVPAQPPKKNKTEEQHHQGEQADDEEESVPIGGTTPLEVPLMLSMSRNSKNPQIQSPPRGTLSLCGLGAKEVARLTEGTVLEFLVNGRVNPLQRQKARL